MGRMLLYEKSEAAWRSGELDHWDITGACFVVSGTQKGEREYVTHRDPGDWSVNYRLLITSETHH